MLTIALILMAPSMKWRCKVHVMVSGVGYLDPVIN